MNKAILNSSVIINSAEDMTNFGRNISKLFNPGDILALTGSLGSGKTTITKGIARGLGIKSIINSPSFTIIKEYHEGRIPLYHMDLYRIDEPEELYTVGFEELIYGTGLSIIEWSEKAEELFPEEYIHFIITILDDGSRRIDIEGLEI